MSTTAPARSRAVACNCLALRQAARRVTQLYDAALAPHGLRTTQFSILVRLERSGPWSVNALAARLVMDRTTLGRSLRPLLRGRLVHMEPDPRDRRSRALSITPEGRARLDAAMPAWLGAQAEFDAAFGADRATALRATLAELATALPR
jgi:DNA-binding MarR family transcriptional regulator